MDDATSLLPETIDALIRGYHGSPFDVLGPHQVGKRIVVRTFIPGATQVSLITAKTQHLMTKINERGLYEVTLTGKLASFAYQFEAIFPDGHIWLHDDPYAFPPELGAVQLDGSGGRAYEQLGSHLVERDGVSGVRFAVWAPNAMSVSVVGGFNQWDGRRHPMQHHGSNGIWELFVPDLREGDVYKYEIKTHYKNYRVLKADPVAFAGELRPNNASIVWNIGKYTWHDETWMAGRTERQSYDAPVSIYELHLGSWRRGEENKWLTYAELARDLVPYVKDHGFTHIELLPVAEHPYDGSWGYQVTGFFAATSRYGTPDDFMAFVDACHQAGIGVLIDWVPAHFATDEHGLGFFDGTHLYEHADPRQGSHSDWGTYIFNYGRDEVSHFLVSSALFWLDKYHIDGLRVDAVASMLYLDFSRKPGEWVANRYGGRENLEAIAFIKNFNSAVHEAYPDTLTFAEESTSWPLVTRPVKDGGLGFDYKWNMGWMHDTLQYFANDPIYRSYHHGTLTFSLLYAFSERFILPFSHDEVVHLKKSMLDKMPGDVWRRLANLRLLYAYQWSHPGKKLLFMGSEFGQWREWSEARGLDWFMLEADVRHAQLKDSVRELNRLLATEKALHEDDFSWNGFQWLDLHDYERSILAYSRTAPSTGETILVVCNFTPVIRYGFRLGVPTSGVYAEIFNSDAQAFGGSGVANAPLTSSPVPWHGQQDSVEMSLPPLAVVYLKLKADDAA